MAGVKIGASHLKYLQLWKSKWNPSDLQRSLHRFKRCLTTVPPRCSFPGDSSTAHDPSSLQLLGICRERCYSMASVAVKGTESLSPAVKYLVDTNNISDLSLITPSGPKDRILKGDVLRYLDDIKSGRIPTPPTSSTKAAAATPVMPAQQIPPPTLSTRRSPSVPVVKMDSKSSPVSSGVSYIDIPVDEVRRSRARQMVQSKATTPHIYASASCSVQKLTELAKSLGDNSDNSDAGGFEAFLIKAAALTLQKLPECNALWTTSEALQPLSSVDVSATLYFNNRPVTALLKGVNRLGVLELHQTIKELLDRTQVSPTPQLQVGNFSVIYLGDSGVSDFTAILSPGQAAVLTIGSIKLTPSDTAAKSKSQQVITVTLTADARVYSDELVCRWLDEFKRTVESPEAYGLL